MEVKIDTTAEDLGARRRTFNTILVATTLVVLAIGLMVQIGLAALGDKHLPIQWNELSAATTMATLPIIILFFFVQRHFLEGITITGLKS